MQFTIRFENDAPLTATDVDVISGFLADAVASDERLARALEDRGIAGLTIANDGDAGVRRLWVGTPGVHAWFPSTCAANAARSLRPGPLTEAP